MKLLAKLQKQIWGTVGSLFASSLEPLADHRNVSSLSLFNRYYFGRCLSELAQLVPFPYSQGRSACYSNRLHDFSVTIPIDVTRMSMSTVSFLAQRDPGMLSFDL